MGRRTRVGIVLGYARSTPHDAYFYDRPEEMIAGAVAAPPIGLGNRDVVLRHINAIAMGAAEPGLSGRMGTYVSIKGELENEPIEELIAAFSSRFGYAADVAVSAFGPDILAQIGLASKKRTCWLRSRSSLRVSEICSSVSGGRSSNSKSASTSGPSRVSDPRGLRARPWTSPSGCSASRATTRTAMRMTAAADILCAASRSLGSCRGTSPK